MGHKGNSKRKPSQNKPKQVAVESAGSSISALIKTTENLPVTPATTSSIKGGVNSSTGGKKKSKKG